MKWTLGEKLTGVIKPELRPEDKCGCGNPLIKLNGLSRYSVPNGGKNISGSFEYDPVCSDCYRKFYDKLETELERGC